MQEIGQNLKYSAQTIADQTLHDWRELAEREPWHRLPPSLDIDHLPSLISQLAETALVTFFGLEERLELADYAVQHGEHRFKTGVSEEVLTREYELLRWSLWKHLKQTASSQEASEAIIRLDSGMTFALGATLRGYHRSVIEGTGDWPDALARYVEGWSFPSG